MPLIEHTENGLYCQAGDFYIDPWRSVDRAIVTHAHSDHARRGAHSYLVPIDGVGLLKHRLGDDIKVTGIPYRTGIEINGVKVSLHPAGHVLGSCMVRVEHRDEVWVFSGDYKVHHDKTCQTMEPVTCHVFITESTFGLPIYRWKPSHLIFEDIHRWWQSNLEQNRCSIIFGYSLGKSQRILSELQPLGPIGLHGAIAALIPAYEAGGVKFPAWEKVDTSNKEQVSRFKKGGMILAPPSANGTPWVGKWGDVATASASGWMTIRGPKRRANVDAGFVLSDHVDWTGIMETVQATGAHRIGITHGYVNTLVKYFQEKGVDAFALETRFQGDAAEE